MTEKKNILDHSIFSKISNITKCLWVNRDRIVATGKVLDPPKNVILRYKPENGIFNFEFGISGLSDFISAISAFKKITLDYQEPILKIKSEDSNSMLTYRTTKKEILQEKVIESTNLGEKLMEQSKKLIDNNKHCSFTITDDMMTRIIKMGRHISSGTSAKINFRKVASDDVVLITIQHKDSIIEFSSSIEIENPGSIIEFDHEFNVDCLLPGEWKLNVFNSTIEHAGNQIPTIWTYMSNNEDMEMIITHDNK